MRANIEVVEAIIGAAVIVADSDGGRWVGTPYFIVRDDGPSTSVTPEGVDKIVGFSGRVPLERHLLNDKPVLLEATYGIVRVYVRPDGEHVYLNDRYCKAVEHMLYSGEDSEFGEPVPPPFFSWWQQAGPLSPVGVTTAADPASTILAVIMPVKAGVMRGLRRRQANVLAFALDRQDARRPVAVDQPCSLCERPGTSGDPVVIRRGEHVAGHRGCLQAHDDRMYAIETALSNPEGGQ